MATGEPDDAQLSTARLRVPDHVVHRDFAGETVALNLDSGMYHGLNPTAARMLEVIGSGAPVSDAIDALAAEFEQPREVVERDVLDLCRSLLDRGLIERDAGADA